MKPYDIKKNAILIKSWQLHNVIQLAKPNEFRLYVNFDLDNYCNYNDFMTVINDIKALGYNPSCVDFYISSKQDMFSKQELENIKKFEKFLDKNNSTLFIKENDVLWNIVEVENAYAYIDSCVDKIKSCNLSTLEQFLAAYKICCDKIYKAEEENENSLISRSVYGVTNTNKIVCVGHANLLKEICNRLQNPNLKVHCCSVEIIDKSTSQTVGHHRHNVVELHDEKYKKDGIYHADSCWDNKKFEEDVMSLCYCLTPINDIKYFSRTQFVPDQQGDFIYLYNDDKPKMLLSKYNENVLKFVKSQKFIDEANLREKFANTIINNLNISGQTDKIEEMKDILSCTPFKSPSIEYSFLRHITNKILNNTQTIEYSNYVDALANVLSKFDGKNIMQTNNFINDVISKTTNACYEKYLYGAKNPFYVLSNEKHKHVEELREKRKAILAKKQNKSKTNE